MDPLKESQSMDHSDLEQEKQPLVADGRTAVALHAAGDSGQPGPSEGPLGSHNAPAVAGEAGIHMPGAINELASSESGPASSQSATLQDQAPGTSPGTPAAREPVCAVCGDAKGDAAGLFHEVWINAGTLEKPVPVLHHRGAWETVQGRADDAVPVSVSGVADSSAVTGAVERLMDYCEEERVATAAIRAAARAEHAALLRERDGYAAQVAALTARLAESVGVKEEA